MASCEDVSVDEAKKEGKVVLYTTMPEYQENLYIKAFNEVYPEISVTTVRGNPGEMPARVMAEARSASDGADVFTFADPTWFSDNEDHLLELSGDSVDAWPEDYWQVDRKAALSLAVPYGMILWNTEQFPDGFETWDDLSAPSVEGRFGTISSVTAAYAGFLDFLERQEGEDHLRELGNLGPKLYPTATSLTQGIAAGEIGVTNVSVPSLVEELQVAGAPIEVVTPTPSYAVAFGSGVLKNSKRTHAACLYLDFMLSEDGQSAYTRDGLGASALQGLPGAIPIENLEIFDSTKFTSETREDWETRLNEYSR